MSYRLCLARRFCSGVSLTFKMENIKVDRPFRLSVEGNIGSGKSTLMNYFKQFPYVETHSEPLDKWRDVQGHNLLGLLYNDLTRWNATFQSYVQLTRTQIQSTSASEDVKVQIFERSVQNNRHCFMENAFRSGFLSPPEYSVLCKWFEWIQENVDISLDLIVYLRSSPDVVYERILARNRMEERTLTMSYLESLHEAHEKWLFSPSMTTPVFVINANQSLPDIVNVYADILPALIKRTHSTSQVVQV